MNQTRQEPLALPAGAIVLREGEAGRVFHVLQEDFREGILLDPIRLVGSRPVHPVPFLSALETVELIEDLLLILPDLLPHCGDEKLDLQERVYSALLGHRASRALQQSQMLAASSA